MRQAKIEIRGAGKIYDGQVALERVTLDVEEGSFTCLLGPSGCGKSTLLGMIAGFVRPSSGAVLVDGVEITRPGADRGIVFQDYALFPWRTVRQNVAFGPMIGGASKAQCRARADHYLAMVGLSAHGGKFPAQLSGGMKQRVAIARALANRPSVLLMDEPFGALDAQTRELLQEELLRIRELEHNTVVFVTHSIAEALVLGDRVVVMGIRPGIVKQVFDIRLQRPREASDAAFRTLEREIRELVRAEVMKLETP
jgi:NitT/TauT family transport system ATP-binding protein